MSDSAQSDPELDHLNPEQIFYGLECRLRIRDTIKLAMDSHMNPPKEDPPPPTLKCLQCDSPFFAHAGWQGIIHPLCLPHWQSFQDTLLRMQDQNCRGMNFELTQIEDAVGMRGLFGRYETPSPKPTTVLGDLILNNIKIDRSAIGVLNTGSVIGSIQHIDASLSILNKEPSTQAFQKAVKEFTEAVLKSTETSNDQKANILELLSGIADEAQKPKEKRRSTVAKSLLQSVQEAVSVIASLHSMWQALQQIITGIFS